MIYAILSGLCALLAWYVLKQRQRMGRMEAVIQSLEKQNDVYKKFQKIDAAAPAGPGDILDRMRDGKL